MKNSRIIVTHYGGSDALQLLEDDFPEPKKGEALVRILTAGVSMPDVMAREGVHPETPRVPFTPGWDFIGQVEELNDGDSTVQKGQRVAALPIHGAYSQFLCIPQTELVPVPAGVDPGEAVSVVLNYITAYQMMHRSAKVKPGQRVLIHGASGGVGTALLQLGKLAGLEMYGTCSPSGAQAVIELGATPIDYKSHDFVEEIYRITGDGVDVVFDPIGGSHLWHSRKALRAGGKVIGYGLISSIRGKGISAHPGKRHRYGGTATFALYIIASRILPGRKRLIPYSIQTLKRLKPEFFRQDLTTLFDLLEQQKIKPVIAKRFPLAEAKQAQELLEKGGVIGKIVLMCNAN
jgi:NADPH2:quinone reductase